MKRIFIFLVLASFAIGMLAQPPDKMSYQAIVRDAGNNLVINQTVGIQISILCGSAAGTVVYTEIQTPTTNENGLLSIEIGGGAGFESIDWTNGPFYIKTEIDPAGGTNYTIIGTSQLLSVPYAFHARTAEEVTGIITETDPVFTSSEAANITATDITNWNNKLDSYTETQNLSDVLIQSNDGDAIQIKNIADPTEDQDAATKSYVDALQSQLIEMENMLIEGGFFTVTDVDGNTYSTVKICDQIWMAENLRTTKYNDGTSIPLVTSYSEWSNLGTPGYCWYGNSEVMFKIPYGALYNWYAVNTGMLCPAGWHIPNNAEWTVLTDCLGGASIAGGKLKEAGTEHWSSPNTGATNETGFTALPGAGRDEEGWFDYLTLIGITGYWWSSTEESSMYAIYRSMSYGSSIVSSGDYSKKGGFSVRCVKD
jgi:uncharacterized protein (TIGR02145 family)